MDPTNRRNQHDIDTYVHAGFWAPEFTVDFWMRNAQCRPDDPALADSTAAYTWAEGARAIDAIAAGLVAARVPRDSVLLVQAPNSALLVLFRLACEQAGIIPAFLHLAFRRSEIEAVAERVHPDGAVFSSEAKQGLAHLYSELKPKLRLQHLFAIDSSSPGIPSIADLAQEPPSGEYSARRVRPYGLTGIATSSGTTGLPKCIEFPCWPRLASSRVYIERLRITERDVILTCIPFHTGGGDMMFHAAPQAGARFVLQSHFVPDATCRLIAQEKASGAVMVPTMIARIASLSDLSTYDLSTLRWVLCIGAMLPYDVGARFENLTGAKIIQGYGLMDYGALTCHGVDDPPERRLCSNGRLLPGAEVLVMDEIGRPLAQGATGEICAARGPYSNGDYIGDPAGMQIAWRDGFFHTGDLGHITEDGYLVLEGRSKDIIIRGGQNISAHEVGAILCRHPAILDAELIRMPDPELGERACAFVVLRPGKNLDFAEMVAFMKSQEIANYKIPERLEIVTQFPMTVVGYKVDKKALEARLKGIGNTPTT